MQPERLEQILEGFQKARIGVIGDFCLDAYWILDGGPRECSVETGKPTFAVTAQRYSLGGAGNVAANLAAMRVGSIRCFAVLGDDVFGREMLNLLERLPANCDGIVIQKESWDTPVYAKPYLGDEEQERVDFGRFNRINPETIERLLDKVEAALQDLDILIVNQQLPQGIHVREVIQRLNHLAGKYPSCRFLVDSRDKSGEFQGMLIKLNSLEAALLCGDQRDVNRAIPAEEVEKYARLIHQKCGKPVFVTRGNRGVVVFDGKQSFHIPGIQILKKTDPVGAGDTLAAAVSASVAAGANWEEAARIANFAAGVIVQKLRQTGTASPQEILAIGTDADYVYNPEHAEDIRRAEYLDDTQIEIINPHLQLGQIRHAVFDHDGTISTLRQGWESIMEPVMIHAIFGDYYQQATEEEYHKVAGQVRDYIDKSTGIQTIIQMQDLAEMVREFGFVPAEKVLDARGYKAIYNEALMEKIRKRLERLEKGELDVSDYTLKGAVDFLNALHQRGVRLYLASGTDEEDVIHEAQVLGYAHLFEGGIFGAVGDITKFSKKMVIDRIIREHGLSGPQLAVFGDGPVELREARKRDGIAVGIASDEIRRYELNLEKRTRLVKAGADILIPDYSQGKRLIQYLFAEKTNPVAHS